MLMSLRVCTCSGTSQVSVFGLCLRPLSQRLFFTLSGHTFLTFPLPALPLLPLYFSLPLPMTTGTQPAFCSSLMVRIGDVPTPLLFFYLPFLPGPGSSLTSWPLTRKKRLDESRFFSESRHLLRTQISAPINVYYGPSPRPLRTPSLGNGSCPPLSLYIFPPPPLLQSARSFLCSSLEDIYSPWLSRRRLFR